MAQGQPFPDVTVSCTGADAVSSGTLASLCQNLQQTLAASFPATRFVLADTDPADAPAFVTLDTFRANRSGLEVQLRWQAAGAAPATGPRTGFSVSDTALIPALQQTFLSRLVRDAALPF